VRIVSLLPSATEIVCALGARGLLVGRSHECNHPPSVAAVPAMTRARFALGTSGAIDAMARAALADATSIFEIDAAKLEEARPDVIVTQDLCDLCAVSIDDVRATVARIARRDDVRLVNLGPNRLADVFCDIKRTADAIGRHDAGLALAERLESRVSSIAAIARATTRRPKVLAIDWIEPPMVAGLWMPELIELAGGVPLIAKPAMPGGALDARSLGEIDPDVVFVAACGFDVERTLEEADVLRARLPSHWRAVRAGRVYVADGNAFFNRPGPRLVESLEILAHALHPRAFAPPRAKAHVLTDRRPISVAGAPASAARSLRSS
jgi:iron complex transport system substrate-binding protein